MMPKNIYLHELPYTKIVKSKVEKVRMGSEK